MNNWYGLTIDAEYKQKYFQKEAEIERLLEKMTPMQTGKRPIICRVLDKLGERLVEAGNVLRARYGVSAQ